LKEIFGSVVLVAFKSFFHSEIYENNIFYFLKIIFNDINLYKQFKNIKKN